MATAPPGPTHPPFRPSTPPTGREVTITAQQVQPPSPLYLQPEDQLQLIVLNPTASYLTLFATLTLRFLRPDGEVVFTRKQISTVSGQPTLLSLGEGFLLSANFQPPQVAGATGGGFFAILTVQRDTPELLPNTWTLFADYADVFRGASWPYGRNILPQEGNGRLRSITGTTPAAGAEISETVPAGARWSLLAFKFSLTTAVAAGTRIPRLLIDDGANSYYLSPDHDGQGASVTQTYNGTPGISYFADGNSVLILPLPTTIFTGQGHRIRTQTSSLQAADQYTAPQYLVQEWVEN